MRSLVGSGRLALLRRPRIRMRPPPKRRCRRTILHACPSNRSSNHSGHSRWRRIHATRGSSASRARAARPSPPTRSLTKRRCPNGCVNPAARVAISQPSSRRLAMPHRAAFLSTVPRPMPRPLRMAIPLPSPLRSPPFPRSTKPSRSPAACRRRPSPLCLRATVARSRAGSAGVCSRQIPASAVE